MARLPRVGSDRNRWGEFLNAFLRVALNEDGSLRDSAVAEAIADALADNQVVIDAAAAAVDDELATRNLLEAIDEDDFASDSAVHVPTQQSTRAYIALIREVLEALIATKLDDTLSPALLLAPAGSRDTRGAVTPTITGTVSLVPGQYGDAWRLGSADAKITIPKAGRWPANVGTVLVRQRLNGAVAGQPYSLSVSGASPDRFQLGLSGAPNPRVLIGAALHSQVLSPAPDYTSMYVHAVRYDSGTVRQFINGTGLPAVAYTGSADGTADITISILVPGSTPFDVESVLIFDQALSDAEIMRLSTMPEAWTWASGRLRFPGVADLTAHLADLDNPHQTTKHHVGLGNVDNTSDLAKPISTATQAALDLKADQEDLLAHILHRTNPHQTNKAHVGLGRADNTSDAEKPLSAAMRAAINQIRSELALDAARYDGDVLWNGPNGVHWVQFEDLVNGTHNTTRRFNQGKFNTGPLPATEG